MAMARGVLDEGRDIRAEGSLTVAEPITSGEFLRAPTTIPGWSVQHEQGERAAQPVDDAVAQGDGEVTGLLAFEADKERRDLGVGLAEDGVRVDATSSAFNSAKFSMMPLWMSASLPLSPGADARSGRWTAMGRPTGVLRSCRAAPPSWHHRGRRDEHLQLALHASSVKVTPSGSITAFRIVTAVFESTPQQYFRCSGYRPHSPRFRAMEPDFTAPAPRIRPVVGRSGLPVTWNSMSDKAHSDCGPLDTCPLDTFVEIERADWAALPR
jgi:hypothetical protein